MRPLPLLLLFSLALACRSDIPENPQRNVSTTTSPIAPAPGTVVGEAHTEHSGDGLNRFTFRVTVTKAAEKGVYTVAAQDGPNHGETQFTLPKGAEDFRVVLRKGNQKNRIEIGFEAPGDTAFYPYYEVVSENKTIRAQYTNAYRFE